MLRYGVIGTGMMGREHIENILALDDATVTAVSDTDESSRVAGVASSGGKAQAFEDHRDLLGSGLVDAVVVAMPNFTHVDVMADVLDSGIHALIEKPLCTTVADCQTTIERHTNPNQLVWMGLEYRYMPPVARLIHEVRSGAVGAPKMVAIREHRFPFLDKVGNWNRFSTNTGGTLVEKTCHFFDLMNLILDERPVRVMASGAQDVNHLDESYDGRRPDILDNAYVIVDYPSGARALLDLCMFADATHNQEEVSVAGPDGKLEALLPENVLRRGRRGHHWIGKVDIEHVEDPDIAHEGLHHGSSYLEHVDFAAAIRGEGPVKVTLEDGLWSVAAGVAAHRSIDEGRPVRLDEVMGADGA